MRSILLILILSCCRSSGQSSETLIQMGLDVIETSPDSAISIFKQAIQLDSGNFQPWYYIAYSYSSTGNFAETAAYAKESLVRNPEDWKSLALLGMAQVESVDKITGCQNLEKALSIDDSDADIKYVFKVLCGKYYRVTIYSELRDSTIIDRISDHFRDGWTLSSIDEESRYIRFNLLNKTYQNHREGRSFEVEWGIYLFDQGENQNLATVKEHYKWIVSEVDYRTLRSGSKELILAIVDKYVKPEELASYSIEKEALIKELKRYARTL